MLMMAKMMPGVAARGGAGGATRTPTRLDAAWSHPDLVLQESGLRVVGNSTSAVKNARATNDTLVGKRYFEILVLAASSSSKMGIADNAFPNFGNPNNYNTAISIFQDGTVYFDGSNLGTQTSSFNNNDVAMFAVDADNLKIWFGLNGTFSGSPAAGTGGNTIAFSGPFFPILTPGANGDCRLNFGASAFAYTPPTGFLSWDA